MLGISNNKLEGYINKNLLSINLNIFSYVFKLDILFPPILKNNLLDLNKYKSKFLPTQCAVDDLELYNDDIYDLLNNPTFYENNQSGYQDSPDNLIPSQAQAPSAGYDYNFKYPGAVQQPVVQYQQSQNPQLPSHFNLNMNGVSTYYFNDFDHALNVDLDVYSSSSESFVSPLDDDFKKKLNRFEQSVAVKREMDLNSDLNSEFSDLDFKYNIPSLQPSVPAPIPAPKIASSFSSSSSSVEIKLENENQLDFYRKRKSTSVAPASKKLKEDDSEDPRFECSICNSKFKVKSYLTRHLKKHQSFKAFKCPFYHENPDINGKGTKCHPTGGFSRRDTYKTHLKALHFIYPPCTKSTERNMVGGRCAGCFNYFDNNVEWLEKHIEKGQCTGTLN